VKTNQKPHIKSKKYQNYSFINNGLNPDVNHLCGHTLTSPDLFGESESVIPMRFLELCPRFLCPR